MVQNYNIFKTKYTFGTILLLTVLQPDLSSCQNDGKNIIYKCCNIQKSYKKSTCASISDADSEFHIITHQDKWQVPIGFTQDGASSFDLLLEARPKLMKKQSCERNRLHFKSPPPGRGLQNDNEVPLGDNETFITPAPEPQSPPKFDENGTMYYMDRAYSSMEYCFDSLFQLGDKTSFDIVLLKNCGKHVSNLLSASSSSFHHSHEKWIRNVFAAVAGLSCGFTLAILVIYLRLRNYLSVSGWTEFAYFIALLLFNALSILGLLLKDTAKDHETICFISSVSVHFFKIATFSSYLMISFDLYWMLRKSDSFASYGEEVEDISKFKLILHYIIILMFPLGLVTWGLVLHYQNLESKDYSSNLIYYPDSCLSPSWQLSEYFLFSLESLTFILILLSLNHILSRLSRSADVEDAPRVSLLSNMLLFTLSYWVMDLLKFARPMFQRHNYNDDFESNGNGNDETFWIVLDGLEYAQGVWVFIVFAFNRKTLRAFKMKSGRDATLREIFRHACCGTSTGVGQTKEDEDEMPMSPLMKSMKSSSMRRSTVRQNHLY